MSGDFNWQKVRAEAVEHFKALLRIDTVNPPGNERPAADYIAKVFDREGISYKIVECEPTRASIVARLPGNGKKKPLLLNGHLDVVPVERESWTYDPFSATEADGCIWGRGAIDMKNMVTMGLMSLVLLKRAKIPLDRDVIFAGVADEEAGSNKGSLFLATEHPDLVRSEYVLNEVGGHTLHAGKTRFYPIQVAEKGICWFELTAEGEPGHGSMPHPNNPVLRLARAIEALGKSRLPVHAIPVVEKFLRTIGKASGFPAATMLPLLTSPNLSSPIMDILEKTNLSQAISLNAMVRNTASPTGLTGSKKVNVIPSKASVQVDGRMIPGESVESFLEEIQRVVGRDLKVSILDQHPGNVFETKTELYDAICGTLRRHDPEGIPIPYMIPGFTDAFAYARLGATCYGFSPVRLGPDLNFTRMYHGHDERIPVEGFGWGVQVLYELVRDFCRAQA
ncbi:MAG: M20/M25/M40 family metallo-hydrolase [Bdellovibrionota bacterium]